jgi:cytidylate kinase
MARRNEVISTVVVTADGEAGSGKNTLMDTLARTFMWARAHYIRDDAGRPFRDASKKKNEQLVSYLQEADLSANGEDLDAESDKLQIGYLTGALGVMRWMQNYGRSHYPLYIFLTGRTLGHWTERLFDDERIIPTAILNLWVVCDPLVSAKRILKSRNLPATPGNINIELSNIIERNAADEDRFIERYEATTFDELMSRGINKRKIDTTHMSLEEEQTIVVNEMQQRGLLIPGFYERLRDIISNPPEIVFTESASGHSWGPEAQSTGIPGLA